MEYLHDERKVIYDPNVRLYSAKTVFITKIVMYNEHFRIDFIQYANHGYKNGGWTCVQPDLFIRPHGTTQKIPMVGAYHIPIAPRRHYFKNKQDRLYFTLLFPAINRKTKFIDIIEKENGNDTNLNFHGVYLHEGKEILKHVQYSMYYN